MNKKTKIDWCDVSWNPVTGCLHGCPYCYARSIANRFGGYAPSENPPESRKFVSTAYGSVVELWDEGGQAVWRKNGKCVPAPFPFGFTPTLHRYRLDEPQSVKMPRTIFVGSMCDLFGDWVPIRWVRDVLDACLAAPWHRYLFLTKNPRKYRELGQIALLPHDDNFWYGATVTDNDGTGFFDSDHVIHTFLSLEPLHGPIDLDGAETDLVIIGAETGNRKGKVVPERAWVDSIAAQCADMGIPVFYKDSVRKLFHDLPASRFPWESERMEVEE